LKLILIPFNAKFTRVAPYTGAWIETEVPEDMKPKEM